jgi:aminodeoxyfutalosine synthase
MTDALELSELEARAEAGERFTAAEAEAVLRSADLVTIGRLGEVARRRVCGDTITFGRVLVLSGGDRPATPPEVGEIRLPPGVESAADMVDRVRGARACAGDVILTGFSPSDFLHAVGGRVDLIADLAAECRAAGLEAVAECPVDAFDSAEAAVEVFQAVARGGLGMWRLTINEAPLDARLPLIERAAAIQDATRAVRAFAPLPRQDPADQPSTGYDDVRMVAVARLMCPAIRHIQVDWPLYGPKLAQVALLYGADDIDGVAAFDNPDLGSRRSAVEDIRRQIRAAAGVPVERNGRYEPL